LFIFIYNDDQSPGDQTLFKMMINRPVINSPVIKRPRTFGFNKRLTLCNCLYSANCLFVLVNIDYLHYLHVMCVLIWLRHDRPSF